MVKDLMFGGNVNILQLEHVNIGVFHSLSNREFSS